MSTRQENQKILMATHLPTFNRLHIIDPYFIAKSAWAPPGEALKIQFFPNELKQGKYNQCFACRHPLSPEEIQSNDYIEGISCSYCIGNVSETKKNNLKDFLSEINDNDNKNLTLGRLAYNEGRYKDALEYLIPLAEKEFKDIVFLSYEQSKNKNIAKKLGIKFWTTIVIYKGDNEVDRIVGQTNKKIIYAAIQKGV